MAEPCFAWTCCRAAALDGAHHLQLGEAHMAAVGVTPGGPVVAEDVRDLQSWPRHGVGGLCRRLLRLRPVKRPRTVDQDRRRRDDHPLGCDAEAPRLEARSAA